mmetsp:Transcript_23722/g.54687  ORF Transcript_23722/g.54687 Transcript_23722/m.54687 type:complete len:216 (-) Transcript_23722:1892-2539(-)
MPNLFFYVPPPSWLKATMITLTLSTLCCLSASLVTSSATRFRSRWLWSLRRMKFTTCWLCITSHSPSVAITINSSRTDMVSSCTSGVAIMISPPSAVTAPPLCWTSPNARETASVRFTRFCMMLPPAARMRSRSSSRSHRCSLLKSMARPLRLSTHRESPTLAIISELRGPSNTATRAVEPHWSPSAASLRQRSRSICVDTAATASPGEVGNRGC